MSYESCFTLQEVSERLGRRVDDLLCDVLNGNLILSADFSGTGNTKAKKGRIVPSISHEISDGIRYENGYEQGWVTDVWDVFLSRPCVIEKTADGGLFSGFGGLHFKLQADGVLIEIFNLDGTPAQRLPNGARWVIREKNLPCTSSAEFKSNNQDAPFKDKAAEPSQENTKNTDKKCYAASRA